MSGTEKERPDEAAVAAESARLAALGRALLAAEPDWVGGRADQERVTASLADLELAAAGVDGRLVLGLLGGTGVGKSTLISALAGTEISPAGPVRPTTSRPVVYRHESFPPLADLGGREVVHRVEALKFLAIVDFPDFDSLERPHHQVVLDYLNRLDLVAWVTDHYKYADRRFYEIMARVQALAGAESQVVLLNKADILADLEPEGAAVREVLDSLTRHLAEFGGWSGPPPWPVSAAEGLAASGLKTAGGLGPLWDILGSLAEAKRRRAVEMGNLQARNRDFRDQVNRAAQPERWLERLAALENLERDFRPQGVIEADLNLLARARAAYLAPRLEHLKKSAAGLLALFTDGWDFVASRFQPGPDTPPPPPEPGAPALVHYLLGRGEDWAAIAGPRLGDAPSQPVAPAGTKGPSPPASRFGPGSPEELAEASGALIQAALDEHLARLPRVGSAPLVLWPVALAALLITAETGGQYGGPSALLAAALRALSPWLVLGFLGDLTLSRFIWFRARRRCEAGFHRALEQARLGLSALADRRLGRPVRQAAARLTAILDLLADLNQ